MLNVVLNRVAFFQEHKAEVVQLEKQVTAVKTRYSVALRNLEQISEQIHAQRGRSAPCDGRSSPVGAEAEVKGASANSGSSSSAGATAEEPSWADMEKTRLWVEKHRESGWGRSESMEDCLSVVNLLTIASDLENCDSVEHLEDLSDSGSVLGPQWDQERKQTEGAAMWEGVAKQKNVVILRETPEGFVKRHQRSVSL